MNDYARHFLTLSFFATLLACLTAVPISVSAADRTDWYIDAVNGDDESGDGSEESPFKSIDGLLTIHAQFPDLMSSGNTLHLAAGRYAESDLMEIRIPGLRVQGTLDSNGKSVSLLGNVTITADAVEIADCVFLDASLTLQNVEGCSISGNLFSGKTKNSLILAGASKNTIYNNRFESAKESCVVIRRDCKSKQTSDENVFQENIFTHPPEGRTRQVILVNSGSSKKRPLSARNRFVNCVFLETIPGKLKAVILDGSTWRMVEEYGYSVRFEDCFFKKADRDTPFSSFTVTGKYPNLNWHWDELRRDTWVASNKGSLLTGNKKNGFTPAIQFVDGDGDGRTLTTDYTNDIKEAIQPSDREQSNLAPIVVNPLEDIAVYENAAPSKINLFDVFDDDSTVDENLVFTVDNELSSLFRSELNEGILTLNYLENAVGTDFVTVTATDDDKVNPKSAKDTFLVIVVEDRGDEVSDRDDWYVDEKKGKDEKGNGSQSKPFRSIDRVFEPNAEHSQFVNAGDTIHLGKGRYDFSSILVEIPNLSIQGTLDKSGRPVTLLGDIKITANGVTLANCEFLDASLTLENVEDVLISNNVFSGTIPISMSLLGASNNRIEHNEFKSAIHDCVHIFWDPESGNSSNNNVFLKNYFTHREGGITNRAIRVHWLAGFNESISYRNHFVNCAFKENVRGRLKSVIADDSTWWMVAQHQYSVKFIDCYFKRADRPNPFSEFVILEGHPKFTWRWDELINDEWISTNNQWGLTGDHSGWNHKPRIQFADGDENGKVFESAYDAGLLPVGSDNDLTPNWSQSED